MDVKRRVRGATGLLQCHVVIVKNQVISFPLEMCCRVVFSVSISYFPSSSKAFLHFFLVEKHFHVTHETFSVQSCQIVWY